MSLGHKHSVQYQTIVSALFGIHLKQMPDGIVSAALAVVENQLSMLIFIEVFGKVLVVCGAEQQK